MGKKNEKDVDKADDSMKQPKKMRNKMIALAVVGGIVAVIAFISYNLDNSTSSKAALIDEIECDAVEYGTFHVHAHLDVFVNGQPYIVPSQVGIIDGTCLYWLHTHNTSGIIHIEAPTTKQFTLGQFFDIWKSTGSVLPPTNGTPEIFVNGQKVNTGLMDTQLNAHDEISVVYGTEPTYIPKFYQFPEGL
jgi:hypothetical protein